MSQSTSSSNSRVPRNQDSGITKESLAENMNSLVNTVGDLSQIVAELAKIVHADISASHEYKKLHIERLEASSNNDALSSLNNIHYDTQLNEIFKLSIKQFNKRIKYKGGINNFMKFWDELKNFLYIHKKDHFVDYLIEKVGQELTKSEQNTLGQIIRAAVDDKIENKISNNTKLETRKGDDTFTLLLFKYIRDKAIGESLGDPQYIDYVQSITLDISEDGLDAYKRKIYQAKQLQSWYRLGNYEASAAYRLYLHLPENIRNQFLEHWRKEHNATGSEHDENITADIRDDLKNYDIFLGYLEPVFRQALNAKNSQQQDRFGKSHATRPTNKDEIKSKGTGNNSKHSKKNKKAYVNKASTVTAPINAESARPSDH